MFRRTHFSDLPALAALWRQAFGDSPEAAANFFDAFPGCLSYVAEEDGRIAAMVHAIPQELCLPLEGKVDPQGPEEVERHSLKNPAQHTKLPATSSVGSADTFPSRGRLSAAYLYAVATDKDYRGRGLCRKLMAFAEDDLKNRGFACCTLTPGEPSLFDFYEKLGYEAVFTRKRASWDGVGTEISPVEYAALRDNVLTVPHISYDVPTLEYVRKAYGLAYYKTPGGCAAASPSYTAEVLPEDVGGQPFAMVKWLTDPQPMAGGYLGLPME